MKDIMKKEKLTIYNFMCKIFGHRFTTTIKENNETKTIEIKKVCRICGKIEEKFLIYKNDKKFHEANKRYSILYKQIME